MPLHFKLYRRTLHFKFAAGTSRGWYRTRDCAFITLEDEDQRIRGIGECAPLPGLSPELDGRDFKAFYQELESLTADLNQRFCSKADLEDDVRAACRRLTELPDALAPLRIIEELMPQVSLSLPSVRFALESAYLEALAGPAPFNTPFAREEACIPINGLIWMGSEAEMRRRLEQKLAQGFKCIKFKIGALDFAQELKLIAAARAVDSSLILRADANGAFTPEEALERLDQLAKYDLHSVEQPIKAGQPEAMAAVCRKSPIPIALDEELIGHYAHSDIQMLLERIAPQYLVLKPTLHGGLAGARRWQKLARQHSIGAWVTSALESSFGLNALAHFTAACGFEGHQGLGTGQLFTDNLEPSPLQLDGELLHYHPEGRRISSTALHAWLTGRESA